MAREKPALEVPRMPLCRPTVRWRDGGTVVDRLAVEEPLEIRIDGRPIAVTAVQAAFEATGGLHATGLFAADGELLCLREDVGRHNAMDKVIGWAYSAGRLPLADCVRDGRVNLYSEPWRLQD